MIDFLLSIIDYRLHSRSVMIMCPPLFILQIIIFGTFDWTEGFFLIITENVNQYKNWSLSLQSCIFAIVYYLVAVAGFLVMWDCSYIYVVLIINCSYMLYIILGFSSLNTIIINYYWREFRIYIYIYYELFSSTRIKLRRKSTLNQRRKTYKNTKYCISLVSSNTSSCLLFCPHKHFMPSYISLFLYLTVPVLL